MDTIVITKTSYKGILRKLSRGIILEILIPKYAGPFNGCGFEQTTPYRAAVKALNEHIDKLPYSQVFQEKEEMAMLVDSFVDSVLRDLDIPELLAYEEAFNAYVQDRNSVEAKKTVEAFYAKHLKEL